MAEEFHWGEIDGQAITFPMRVASLNQATLTFQVPSQPAAALLPGRDFEISESAPGQTQLLMALVDYRENPWGSYDEVNLGFPVHPVGRPEVTNSFVYRMPVNQEFTCKAGNTVMGFPKTVEQIDFAYSESHVEVRLAMGGREVLRVRLPRVPAAMPPPEMETVSYSYLDGKPLETPLRMQIGTGAVDPAEVLLELGDSPVADELRSLGLRRPPDLCTWAEGLSATFQRPRPV